MDWYINRVINMGELSKSLIKLCKKSYNLEGFL